MTMRSFVTWAAIVVTLTLISSVFIGQLSQDNPMRVATEKDALRAARLILRDGSVVVMGIHKLAAPLKFWVEYKDGSVYLMRAYPEDTTGEWVYRSGESKGRLQGFDQILGGMIWDSVDPSRFR